jgi:N-acetylglutamate synthase
VDERLTDDVLARLADINMANTWEAMSRLAGCPTERVGALQLYASGLPMAFFNGAIATDPVDDPDAAVAAALAFMASNDVPWLLWVRAGLDEALLDAGRAAGLRDAGGPPVMGWSPIDPPADLRPDLEISVVRDRAGIEAHHDLAARGFDAPLGIFERLVTDATVADPSFALLVGRADGEPVSTAVLSVSGTTGGIYNVATPPEHQRRGYGRALTCAAVDEAVRRGCDHAILQSSSAGRPVYEALGFRELGRYVQLEGPPA